MFVLPSGSAVRRCGLVLGALATLGVACKNDQGPEPKEPGAPPARVVIGDFQPAPAVIRNELKGVFSSETPQGPSPSQGGQVTRLNGRSGDAGAPPGTTTDEVVGAVQRVLPHPTNPKILYVAAVNGGIWRTLDATAASPQWKPLTDFLYSLSISDLALDPQVPDAMIAGTGNTSSAFAAAGTGRVILARAGGDDFREIPSPFQAGGNNVSVVAIRQDTTTSWTYLVGSSNPGGVGGLHRGTYQVIDTVPPPPPITSMTRISGVAPPMGSPGVTLPNGSVTTLVRDTSDPSNPNRVYVDVVGQGLFFSNNWVDWFPAISADTSGIQTAITGGSGPNTRNRLAVSRTTGRIYAKIFAGEVVWVGSAPAPSGTMAGVWRRMEVPRTPTGITNAMGTPMPFISITPGGLITTATPHNLALPNQNGQQ